MFRALISALLLSLVVTPAISQQAGAPPENAWTDQDNQQYALEAGGSGRLHDSEWRDVAWETNSLRWFNGSEPNDNVCIHNFYSDRTNGYTDFPRLIRLPWGEMERLYRERPLMGYQWSSCVSVEQFLLGTWRLKTPEEQTDTTFLPTGYFESTSTYSDGRKITASGKWRLITRLNGRFRLLVRLEGQSSIEISNRMVIAKDGRLYNQDAGVYVQRIAENAIPLPERSETIWAYD